MRLPSGPHGERGPDQGRSAEGPDRIGAVRRSVWKAGRVAATVLPYFFGTPATAAAAPVKASA